jgi:hypothetical protein
MALGDMTGRVVRRSAFRRPCAVCVTPFLLLYFLQYRRKLQQTQREQILAILEDLQREIAALRERTPHRDDQP